jgi:DNA-binding XRE family transcriptional regulator
MLIKWGNKMDKVKRTVTAPEFKRIRRSWNLSQRELGRVFGVSVTTIWRLERTVGPIAGIYAEAICDLAGGLIDPEKDRLNLLLQSRWWRSRRDNFG